MPISVELRAGPGFEQTLPGDGGDTTVELGNGATLADVVELLNLDGRPRFLTAVNDEVVVASKRDEHALSSGDVVDILPPLTGG